MKIKLFLPVLALAPVALFSFKPAESANYSKIDLATKKVNYQIVDKKRFEGDIIINKAFVKASESVVNEQLVSTVSKESSELSLQEFVNSHE